MKKITRIACGISGGVDSSVAAFLLKQKGFEVVGVFMRNWEHTDESGVCTIDKDLKDAQETCKKLNIKLIEADFIKEYWNYVFIDMVNDYKSGLTPNPDILCNHHIKFDAFYKYAINQLNVDAIATGHYARTNFGPFFENYNDETKVKLIRGVDDHKDQSFFLSRVPQLALRYCSFPVGNLQKSYVRKIAAQTGLQHVARKPDSVGICFIGAKNFKDFMTQYVEPNPGKFIDIDSGKMCGTHNGIHLWTLGQRCNLSGCLQPYYVAHKEVETQTIYVASGVNHPALYACKMIATKPHWIAGSAPEGLLNDEIFECDFCFQHTDVIVPCRIQIRMTEAYEITLLNGPLRAITPGQYAVFYEGDECLGCARIQNVLHDTDLNYKSKGSLSKT